MSFDVAFLNWWWVWEIGIVGCCFEKKKRGGIGTKCKNSGGVNKRVHGLISWVSNGRMAGNVLDAKPKRISETSRHLEMERAYGFSHSSVHLTVQNRLMMHSNDTWQVADRQL